MAQFIGDKLDALVRPLNGVQAAALAIAAGELTPAAVSDVAAAAAAAAGCCPVCEFHARLEPLLGLPAGHWPRCAGKPDFHGLPAETVASLAAKPVMHAVSFAVLAVPRWALAPKPN
jgi:hypothetical protein